MSCFPFVAPKRGLFWHSFGRLKVQCGIVDLAICSCSSLKQVSKEQPFHYLQGEMCRIYTAVKSQANEKRVCSMCRILLREECIYIERIE